jgi:hypothetical protein
VHAEEEYVVSSAHPGWYRERLVTCQNREIALCRRHTAALEQLQEYGDSSPKLDINARLAEAQQQLQRCTGPAYPEEIQGTIGADPFYRQIRPQ